MILYIPKVGKIYVTTLQTANTWYQVLTEAQAKAIRGFKIKSRMTFDSNGNPTTSPRPFDYAFNSSPASGDTTTGNGFWSGSGSGAGDEAGPVKGIWARSAVAGTQIEIMTYD